MFNDYIEPDQSMIIDDGRVIRERAEKINIDISEADVSAMEVQMTAEHEKFIQKEIACRNHTPTS